ncbi:hypothetical protein DJ564_11205 [Pseudomonas sp. 31-12]|uniref:hypothetical protein n=1 Tax=Pseudomonas sp. 31-12 TaxID=2201356 RepID=UPI000D6C0ACF|nr:hypothetical protein [Pseudomonas sp. 31-12]AWM91355.1 hypothetical protein DJ564_11205 [Pseudomonas sp. 31-12]
MAEYFLKVIDCIRSADAPNFVLPSFPPALDFPVSVNFEGDVVSRFGFDVWDVTQMSGQANSFHFGEFDTHRSKAWQDGESALCFRLIIAYLKWGDRHRVKMSTIIYYYTSLKSLFKYCASVGVCVLDLHKRNDLVKAMPSFIKGDFRKTLHLLTELYSVRELLGFFILTPWQISSLLEVTQAKDCNQTAFIPERIWCYQANRCLEMLREVSENKDRIGEMFRFCVEACIKNNGEMSRWEGKKKWISPFGVMSKRFTKATYVGAFVEVAQSFGLKDLMEKWICRPGRKLEDLASMGAVPFSTFLSAVGKVGAITLVNFSGMREGEVIKLRANCFVEDEDEDFGKFCYLQGETTKTIEEFDARWVTSPAMKEVVETMAYISKLRMECLEAFPNVSFEEDEFENPYLLLRSYEPWGLVRGKERDTPTSIRTHLHYREWVDFCPGLFDPLNLVITEGDLAVAQAITPTLDSSLFEVGKIWPLRMHQLRRTLVVNAARSGKVSDKSLQFQLKHLYLEMSLYYARNSSLLGFNSAIRKEYVDASFEAIAVKAKQVLSDGFVSLLSDKHKEKLVEFMNQLDFNQLISLARESKIHIRETILGVCMNPQPCPYGGFDNVAPCADCLHGLVNREHRPMIEKLDSFLESQLAGELKAGPQRESFEAQYKVTQRVLDVIAIS